MSVAAASLTAASGAVADVPRARLDAFAKTPATTAETVAFGAAVGEPLSLALALRVDVRSGATLGSSEWASRPLTAWARSQTMPTGTGE